MIRSVSFDAKKFSAIMSELSNKIYGVGKFTDAVTKIAANYEGLKHFRKNIIGKHATFLENLLVNELFMNCYPWRFEGHIIKNFGVFVIKYKIFEIKLLSAALKNPLRKADLISLAEWFTTQFNHVEINQRRIFDYLKGKEDTLNLMESLLEGD